MVVFFSDLLLMNEDDEGVVDDDVVDDVVVDDVVFTELLIFLLSPLLSTFGVGLPVVPFFLYGTLVLSFLKLVLRLSDVFRDPLLLTLLLRLCCCCLLLLVVEHFS
jgi:hypothetical protein